MGTVQRCKATPSACSEKGCNSNAKTDWLFYDLTLGVSGLEVGGSKPGQ